MQTVAATLLVFSGGFALMVLEIVGARWLARDFGSSFYVWTSQIGVILVALAAGYYAGGALADRAPHGRTLAILLIPAGVLTGLIPEYAPQLTAWIVNRHPADAPIPLLWQKLDPALGSALVFFLPCFALATLPPFAIRWSARQLSRVGRTSGAIIAASTVGGIVGVGVAGYVLIDVMRLSDIFRALGALTVLLGLAGGTVLRVPSSGPIAAGAESNKSRETS